MGAAQSPESRLGPGHHFPLSQGRFDTVITAGELNLEMF